MIEVQEYLPGIPGSTALGWRPPPDGFTKDDVVGWLKSLQGTMESVWWNVGDMMNVGTVVLEDEIYQAYIYNYEPETIARVRAICETFPIDERRKNVSIWKHEIVKNCPPDVRDNILDKADDKEAGGMSMKAMYAAREEAEQEGKAERISGGFLGTPPECPECGAESRHWARPPASMAKDSEMTTGSPTGTRRGHLEAV